MPTFDSPIKTSTERGFALISAIIACTILFALATLIILISTRDLRVSARSVGNKKALIAAEAGINQMLQNFDRDNWIANQRNRMAVEGGGDPGSVYSVATPTLPAQGPAFLPIPGQDMSMQMKIVDVTIAGENQRYGTRSEVVAGVGYGPVPVSTMP